jgi:hypothetical protein
MRFSERINKREIKVEIQLDYIDPELKNGLWNILCAYLFTPLKDRTQWLEESNFEAICEDIWFSHFKEAIDSMPISTEGVVKEIRKRFFSWNYLETYDFIDFLATSNDDSFDKDGYVEAMNFVLKRDLSGYRFINYILSPITNEGEINTIEEAILKTSEISLNGVNIHLSEALVKLSDKRNPDYRNSIKESISALESLCQKITGEPKAELGKALKLLNSKLPIHGSLGQGFTKLYGYTSDGDGIRHAMMEETNLDQEDALYMLVTISSFINYLIVKANKVGLKLN